ncbi:TIGR02757 family protein [Aquimarina agarilytica]|uniref:TIGR02757 family protein n=1 Tax=Aquimarina agarilytica TaxID=1087449 RepID=UPI0002893713|nr:TIGR02757 family protein [Aquimarina agarilytica]
MKKLPIKELKAFLDEKAALYETPTFLDTDPIQVPAQFSLKEDAEIAGFLTATIAWGNRKSILTNAHRLMEIMGHSPYDFVMNYTPEKHSSLFDGFVHRTFNNIDLGYFIEGLQHLYTQHGTMENYFNQFSNFPRINDAITNFKHDFFSLPHPKRTTKHISDPSKNSAAKRINMFFRWMVRPNTNGVDLGLWTKINTNQLSCPLDVHSGNVARKLGILLRKQNDAKALLELDTALRKMDANDPVKYDYALFGLGVFEKF